MPVIENWIKDPLQIINNIFGKNYNILSILIVLKIMFTFYPSASDPLNFETKVTEYFEEKLKSEKFYSSVSFFCLVFLLEL
jgi:hypothetical protein